MSSDANYEMTVDRDVSVPLRDGTRVLANVHRPDAPGRFPALVSMTPYCKDVEDLTYLGPKIGRFNLEYAQVEGGDSEFWAAHGYVHVVVEIRGTGNSEGSYHGLLSPQEAPDGYDVVEWTAEQAWCDGNVGMIGLSYLGITQFTTAAERPPHLKAIAPLHSFTDLYRDFSYHGGIPSRSLFSGILLIPARGAFSVAEQRYEAAELQKQVDSLLADKGTNYATNPYLVSTLRSAPETRPITFDGLVHPEDGPYWRERSAAERLHEVEVPTYLGANFHAHSVPVHLPGAVNAWSKISTPKKLSFHKTNHGGVNRPFYEHHDELLRWFDHWLKGEENGVMDEPRVKIWVRGREEYRYADEWPLLTDTDWTRFYLRGGGRLTANEPPASGEAPARMDYEPALPVILPQPVSPPPPKLSYTTEPFETDVEVVGPLALYLQASLSGDDGDFIVSVRDVGPDGAEFPLSRGWLRASHRELDQERSVDWQPYHTHTNPTPLTPNERYEFAIEIRPIANLFKAGHRLKLEILPCDFPSPDPTTYDWTQFWGFVHHIPYGKPVSYDVHHTPDAPSYLLVPVLPAHN
jgi:predicted acyl esterase